VHNTIFNRKCQNSHFPHQGYENDESDLNYPVWMTKCPIYSIGVKWPKYPFKTKLV